MPNLPPFHAPRDWTNPADFPTHQNNEAQNRADLQEWFTLWENWFNNIFLPALALALANAGTGTGGTGTGTGGASASGRYLPLSGGTMAGILRLYRDPLLDQEAATKKYADDLARLITADVNANAGAIRQTGENISQMADDNDNRFTSLEVRADAIESRINDVDGSGSAIEQTAQSIISRVTDAEGNLSSIAQTINGISMSVERVTENGVVYSRITLTIGENSYYGYIRMEGNVDVSGQLSAEALYSGYGEIANLAVDQLITSRRIVKYLAGDTSDDNFIRAYQQNMEWVTGHYSGGTMQAKNPDGSPLYWPVDVSGLSRGSDGYPVTGQGERIFTVTVPTSYPVMVYTYDEEIKRSISFEAVNGIYSPIDRFGAGNKSGNNRAWILKTADGFDIRYLTPDNKEIGIHMGTDGKVTIDGFSYDTNAIRESLGMAPSDVTTGTDGSSGGGDGTGGNGGSGTGGSSGGGSGGTALDLTRENEDGSTSGITVDAEGHTDISGLRKPVTIDFSGLSSGAFSETLDGGVYNTYSVERDGSGRITKITDGSGHETAIIW